MENLRNLIETDITFLENRLEEIEREYKEKIDEVEEALRSPFQPFHDSLDLFRSQLEALEAQQDSDTAFRALLACHAIDSQGSAIEARLVILKTRPAQYLAQVWSGFWSRVKGVIQSIASNLWALISQYLNLKEWSIKGSVTTPAITQVFGLTGSAELQLTFEK